ncbi:MAG TPA: hypothetical protein VMB50_10890 [Myxococcales bacterium]|nr:hypothetical protein [Myxococcales bacterium]
MRTAFHRGSLWLLCLALCGGCASRGGGTSGSTGASSSAGSSGGASSGGTSGGRASSGGTSGGGASSGGTSGSGGSTGGLAACAGGENSPCPFDGGQGICCAGSCVDVLTSLTNCGACGQACPVGGACSYASCVLPDGGPDLCVPGGCPAGTLCLAQFGLCFPTSCAGIGDGTGCTLDGGVDSCCGGSCIDQSTDPSNCGLCHNVCPAGTTCTPDGISADCDLPDGRLEDCSDGGCPAGTRCTGASCLPTTCDASEQGQFECANPSGGPGLGTCCESSCTDRLSDPQNCGVCGNVCPAGSFCSYGSCPAISCAGAPSGTACVLASGGQGSCCNDSCVDTTSDPQNCQYCGFICPTGATCNGSLCSSGCTADSCPAGTLCFSGEFCERYDCSGVADGQTCLRNEDSSYAFPQGECCGGACVDTNADPDHCGGCGIGNDGGVCINGDLFPPPPGTSCDGFCPVGETCEGAYCVGPCASTSSVCPLQGGSYGACCFPPGETSTVCVDVLTDPANCGFCDQRCPAGQSCVDGSCSGAKAPCVGGRVGGFCNLDAGLSFLCCPGGGCTDTSSDPGNCGGCGNACDGGSCVAGSCQ